jgi:hypothetical protein
MKWIAMRYTLSLVLLTLLGVAALKGSLTYTGNSKKLFFIAQQSQNSNQMQDDYNEMSVDPTPPDGLNDEATEYWTTLTPQQKQAVRQDIQNGVDPNQAVMNYAQVNNRQPSNVEGSGSHSTQEGYDSEQPQNSSSGTNSTTSGKISSKATDGYSGRGSSDDEDQEKKNRYKDDPSDRTYYAPGGQNSPEAGNEW